MKSLRVLLLLSVVLIQASAFCAEPLRVFIRAGEKTHGPGAHDHPRFLSEWTKLLNERGAKADGSLQCGAQKGIAVELMEKDLRGIKVLSRDKRSDGKMHIQLCGSPTGMINVYEISESQLKDAEARGFKKL